MEGMPEVELICLLVLAQTSALTSSQQAMRALSNA